MRSLALLAILVAGLVAPAHADYSWDYHSDPTICHLREVAYAIDGVHRQEFRLGGIGSGVVSNAFLGRELDSPMLGWHIVFQTNSPPARRRAQSFYDARRERFLFLGGIDSDSTRHADVWSWDRSSGTWSLVAMNGAGPDSITLDFPLTYDSRNDRLIYVNNAAAGNHPMIWRLDLSTDPPSWTSLQLPASFTLNPYVAPNVFQRASAAYDSLGNRLFLEAPYIFPSSGLYVVDFSSPTGFDPVPAKNFGTSEPRLAVDPVHNRLILDVDDLSGQSFLDYALTTYDLATMDSTEIYLRQVPNRRPGKGQALAWATNPVTGAIEVPFVDFPDREGRATVVPDAAIHWVRRDAEERSLASWGMAGAVDPLGRSLYLFGGVVSLPTHGDPWHWDDHGVDDLYRVELDDPSHQHHLEPSGVGPGALTSAVAVFDSAAHRLVLYGGWNAYTGGYHTELWALELEPELHWSQIATTNLGPLRARPGMTIDPVTRRIYLVGGGNPLPATRPGFLWSLDLTEEPATWTLVRSNGPDNPGITAGFDRVHHRILGVDPDSTFTIELSDTTIPIRGFFFNGADPINGYSYRNGISGVMDVLRNVLFVHGGKRPYVGYNDYGPPYGTGVWSGDTFKDTLTVPSKVVPPGRNAFMAFDPVLDRLILVNGYHVNGFCNTCDPADTDTPVFGAWTLQLDDAVPALVDLADVALELRGVRVRFSGAGADGPVRVERSLDGTLEWTWIGDAREVAPGMYEWFDERVAAGTAYRYRARYTSDGAERITAMSDAVLVPGSVDFALRAPEGAVGGGWPVVLEGQVTPGANARVELIDVAGRVVSRRAVNGAFRASLAPLRPSAGIYFARLVQGERTAKIKLVRF